MHNVQSPRTDDSAIEQEIQAKGLTAPRITPQQIDALMERVSFTGGRIGATTSTVVHAFLDGEFLLASGHSACVSASNFDADLGYSMARRQAADKACDQLWLLEGYVLRDKLASASKEHPLDRIARVCHEVNRAYCQALGDNSQPAWEDAPEWQRASARMGVDLHTMGDFGPEASHISWMRQKQDDGWTYGPVKDPEAKQHPCMVPFAELPREQQAKDFIFRAVVHALR